jgi:hypothetical protein
LLSIIFQECGQQDYRMFNLNRLGRVWELVEILERRSPGLVMSA